MKNSGLFNLPGKTTLVGFNKAGVSYMRTWFQQLTFSEILLKKMQHETICTKPFFAALQGT